MSGIVPEGKAKVGDVIGRTPDGIEIVIADAFDPGELARRVRALNHDTTGGRREGSSLAPIISRGASSGDERLRRKWEVKRLTKVRES